MHSRYSASADIGSNSIHLIVAEISGGSLRVVHQEKEVLRLGFAGGNDKKMIGAEFTLQAARIIKRFSEVARSFGAPLKIVATSAVRESGNAEEFVRSIYSETGLWAEVISGRQEAGFVYSGVITALPELLGRQCLCIDIGGGSTELITGREGNILFSESLKLGAVRLTESCFPDYILTAGAVDRCYQSVYRELEPVSETIKESGFDICAGTSGTIMSAAMVHKYSATRGISAAQAPPALLTGALNNYTMSAGEISCLAKDITNYKSAGERKMIPGLEEQRADIFPAGLFILDGIVRALQIPSITVSAFSLREGLLVQGVPPSERHSDPHGGQTDKPA